MNAVDRKESILLVPQQAFFTKGVGHHRNRLQSFELSLRHAGIEKANLVRVSPAFCHQAAESSRAARASHV